MEVELKLSLDDESQARSIAHRLGPPLSESHQENLYFDEKPGFWRHSGWSVRLRRSEEGLLLTVKGPAARREQDGDFHVRLEYECRLPRQAWEELRQGGEALGEELIKLMHENDAPDLPANLDPRALLHIGSLENRRQVFVLPGEGPQLRVELDRSRYPGELVGYELELEVDERDDVQGAHRRVRALFDELGLPWRPSRISKQARVQQLLSGPEPGRESPSI